jgi:hypothetical protein
MMAASVASSTGRSRQRKRDGKRLVEFEVDEIGVIILLSHHGLLSPCSDDDGAINRALKQLVDRLIEA